MLIEHTSGSIEDKPETEKMWWCVTAVNRMLQPAKSPWSANPACVTTTLKTATQSTQSQPQKSQCCPEKSTQNISKKVNAARSLVNLLTSVLVPICMSFQNRSLHQNSTSLDHALTKVNAGKTCVATLAAVNSSFFPTCEPKLLPRSSY